MARNVEVKIQIDSIEDILPIVADCADEGPIEIRQDDIFFNCPNWRLKLRIFSESSGELIFYQRPDIAGPKASFYIISPAESPHMLRQVLSTAYGEAGYVSKHRILFMIGQTRVHLDRVKGLGDFIELEVVLGEGETIEQGRETAQTVLERLGLSTRPSIEKAYVDLQQSTQASCVDE